MNLVIHFFSPTRAGCSAVLNEQPATQKALQPQPIPSFLKELNSLGKKISSSQKDPLQIPKLKTKIFYLLLETQLHCKANQIAFSHSQLIAGAAHSKGTARKFKVILLSCVLWAVCWCFSLFCPLENIWRGHTAFKAVLVLPWDKLAPSLPWREVRAAVSCMSSFVSTDMPEIGRCERVGPKEQHKCCSW